MSEVGEATALGTARKRRGGIAKRRSASVVITVGTSAAFPLIYKRLGTASLGSIWQSSRPYHACRQKRSALVLPRTEGIQMLKILSICAALSLSFVFTPGAMAQSGGGGKSGIGTCWADIKKVCGNTKPGGNRIATCLKEHVADLSDACKARLADIAAARKTCGADIEKQQCGTKSRIQKVTCIKDAIANLGDECKAAIAAVVTSKK